MKTYSTMADLIGSLDLVAIESNYRDPSACWLFTRIPDWERDPLTAKILVLDDEDEESGYNPDNEDLPLQALELNMQRLLDYAAFEDVLAVQFRQNSVSTTKDFVDALIYYHENDSFLQEGDVRKSERKLERDDAKRAHEVETMSNEKYEEEDAVLAGVMEEATGFLRDILPPDMYRELRYDVGLTIDLHPETGAVLESLRHKDTNVETSGPLKDDAAAQDKSESA